MSINTNSIVRRKPEPLFTRLDDDLLALDPDAGDCYSLNRSAARVWELIEQPTSVADICARLEAEFDVGHVECTGDVIELIGALRQSGLVEVR